MCFPASFLPSVLHLLALTSFLCLKSHLPTGFRCLQNGSHADEMLKGSVPGESGAPRDLETADRCQLPQREMGASPIMRVHRRFGG